MRKVRAAGFSLMELLIVVIIVGILAAVAMPQFNRMSRRARASEASGMVGAIMTAEWVLFNETGAFVAFADNAGLNALGGANALGIQVPADAATNWDYTGVAGPPFVVTATADNTPVAGSGLILNPAVVVTGTLNIDGTRTVVTTVQ
jgi:prepilin-type N-terminal cleavage/methylation domain-containing protein